MPGGENKTIAYQDYRFGRARQRFRGPRPDLSKPYLAFIGGSEVYGKFVADPFPAQIQHQLNMECANWGTPGAGPTFYLKDPVVMEACSGARACVISVMGAVQTSNRLYSVFKRRNSRLKSTSESLQALFPDIDLSRFRYTHNMLHRLYRHDPKNFRVLEIELRDAWIARMRELLDDIETTRILLWMSKRLPEEPFPTDERDGFVAPPAFVTRQMLEAVSPSADMVIEYVAAKDIAADPEDGRVYDPDCDPMAPYCPGQTMHDQTAELMVEPLRDVLNATSRRWF